MRISDWSSDVCLPICFDTSLNWRPLPDLTIRGGVVYADARILEAFQGAPKGTRVQSAPEWTGNASIEYRAELSDRVDLRLNPTDDFSSRQLSKLQYDRKRVGLGRGGSVGVETGG